MHHLDMNSARLAVLVLIAALLAPALAVPQEGAAAGATRDITWDDLLPEGWVPPAAAPVDHFFDAAPTAPVSQADAPVVVALDEQRVRLPGYLVPLDVEDEKLRTFLMVPYFGACIHVPPPPPNQVVYVEMAEPVAVEDPYGAHWVTGVISTQSQETDMAQASYSMSGVQIDVFDWDAFYEAQAKGN